MPERLSRAELNWKAVADAERARADEAESEGDRFRDAFEYVVRFAAPSVQRDARAMLEEGS